jgi:DNA-binding MarR family transcriptional regulator
MSEIVGNEKITQRELSKKLGVSVSTVNVLMNKMIKEGLIKMTQVSHKQVLYMLTPAGMMEKAKKTISYLKIHYRVIYETKEKTKLILESLSQEYDTIFVLLDDEMSEVLRIAIDEFQASHREHNIVIIGENENLEFINAPIPVLIHMAINEDKLREYSKIDNLKVINLVEQL